MKLEWAVFAAQVLFLWMFLAADPLEQLANRGHLEPMSATTREQAYRFAADWRHGMAGDSPLYLPGFFAVALATWIRDRRRPPTAFRQALLVLLLAILAARLAAPLGSEPIVQRFVQESGLRAIAESESASWATTSLAAYTLLTWSVFVVGCRRALAWRSLWPLAPALPMTGVLAAVRPWTVGDFSTLWASGIASGDAPASGSLVAWLLLFVGLIASEQRTSPQPSPTAAV